MKQSNSLIEPLTKRELEILSLLATDCTNGEIAAQLTLSLNTVKWYARQIYAKLGVADRREAVVEARESGLLGMAKPSSDQEPSPSFPSGTVTFLFTDIEGSTPLWELMPSEMQASVAQHHALLRQSIEANEGHVFQIIGDAFQAAFRLAPQALRAALAAQRALQSAQWGKTGPLKVRMGLHTGPAELDPIGNAPYAVSHTLNRSARVMSAGHGGQILLSQEAADLVERDLAAPGPLEGVSLRDLGEHRLKGMQRLEHLYQVVVADLPQSFPPLATGIHCPNNLPVQLSSFIGREAEMAEVAGLLQMNRLVTLNDSGGTGKTRLALRVAEEMLEAFPEGIWFIDLAPLTDPELVIQTVTSTLGLQRTGEISDQAILDNYLRDKRLLLILDNCEHLLEACARLAQHLLQYCPKLCLLATSRESLGIAGEVAYRVPSLSALDPSGGASPAELAKSDSVRLFADRAAAVRTGFQLSKETLPAAARTCYRLDGIPLAIELAAARVDILSVEQIAARLDDRFRLLTGGSRTALPRQRTLRASIDWSYNLLSERERLFLQRLSVFSGGWNLPAAEAVCAGDGLEGWEILDALSGLVEKSLVVADAQSEAEMRYHMLETVRQYAQERMDDSGQGAAIRDRHLAYFLSLAEEYGPLLHTPKIYDLLERLDLELDNLRGALSWALGKNDPSSSKDALRMLCGLFYFWLLRSLSSDFKGWFNRSCQLLPEDDLQATELRAYGLLILSLLKSVYLENLAETLKDINMCIHLCRQAADRREVSTINRWKLALALAVRKLNTGMYIYYFSSDPSIPMEEAQQDGDEDLSFVQDPSQTNDAVSDWFLAWTYIFNALPIAFPNKSPKLYLAEKDQVRHLLQSALEISFRLGDKVMELYIYYLYIFALLSFNLDVDASESLLFTKRGIILAKRLGSKSCLIQFLVMVGFSAYQMNQLQEMEDSFREIAFITRQVGEVGREIFALRMLGFVAVKKADVFKAWSFLHQALELSIAHEDMYGILAELTHFAGLAQLIHQKPDAARLLGFVEHQLEGFLKPMDWWDQREFNGYTATMKEDLSEANFAALWAEGREMTMEQALQMARALPKEG